MKTETVRIDTSFGRTTAFVAQPEGDLTAAVVLIHEWWGLNAHIRDIASRYAKEGYLCIAPDLYRGDTPENAEEASKLMHRLAVNDGLETIGEAIAAIKRLYRVHKIGITGYCMGGTFALRAACEISELAAAAPFYGDIPEEETLKKLRVPTVFMAGKRDAWINQAKVNSLIEACRKYNLLLEVFRYDADHAFFNDTRRENYDADAAADAWTRVLDLFRRHLALAPTNA